MKKVLISTCLVALTVMTTQQVIAHGGATGVVKERMDLMEDMKDSVKAVSAIFKGETDYSADTIRKAAETIKTHSGDAMTKLFPEGSLSGHSEAKPLIWDEWQRFKLLSDRQVKLADGLFRAAENKETAVNINQSMMGSGGMMASSGSMMGSTKPMTDDPDTLAQMPSSRVFQMVADNCSSCHERYRIED
ncbi:c-type cytochrome [Amphritea japonica]|uniref:Cytochrome c n=1 Tax=Amphritea japonica ATCC BAA-1530 TaxID=1278309 RepID=A0A7R6P8R6_9GAMM|nr:cytochrome c [Amphritea japonica]BBB24938.1 cytochrome c [Amphritea japonica ATCC BAA-1530]